MNSQILSNKIKKLNQRLRILILRNVREEDLTDNDTLLEMHKLTGQILQLKQALNGQNNLQINQYAGLAVQH
jgi:hypothetical protein